MKWFKIFRNLSVISYCLIILMGQMTGIPFIVWLIFTIFDLGNSDHFFAIAGFIGLLMQFVKLEDDKKGIKFSLISFVLLLLPIIKRLTAIPIENYFYPAFLIPLFCFIVFYILAISQRNRQLLNKKCRTPAR